MESLLNFGARDDTGFFSIDDVTVVAVSTPEPGSFALISVASLLVVLWSLGRFTNSAERT